MQSFQQRSYSIIHFICPSVSPSVTLWGNVISSAPIKDRHLKFLVKNPIIYAHLIHTLFCPPVCYLGSRSNNIHCMTLLNIKFFPDINSSFLSFATYGCCQQINLIYRGYNFLSSLGMSINLQSIVLSLKIPEKYMHKQIQKQISKLFSAVACTAIYQRM